MTDMRIIGCLLAAGASRRFGPSNKLLAHWHGQPLVHHAANALAGAPFAERIAVLGHDAKPVGKLLRNAGFKTLENPHWQAGMGTSVGLAARYALSVEASHLLVLPGDMPSVTADDIMALLERVEDNPHALVRAHDGERAGNPVILPAPVLVAVSELAGDVGARDLIAATHLPVVAVDIGKGACTDIDTSSDLAASMS